MGTFSMSSTLSEVAAGRHDDLALTGVDGAAGRTRFSETSVVADVEIEKPSWARRAVENSIQIVSSWTP